MTRHLRRAVLAASGAAVLVLGAGTVASASSAPSTPPASQTGDNPPAEASGASGSIVNVEFFQTCISCTTAQTGTHRAEGGASAIRVVGHEIAGGESGSRPSNPSQRGALLALPVNPFLSLAIANWRTTSSGDAEPSTSFSHSRAALVDLALLGGTPADSLLTVALLESTSDATYTGALSHGAAVVNGVHVTALNGALVLILLHSEASSDRPGSSYILSVNGNRLLTSSQPDNDDGDPPTTIPGVLAISLLQVDGHGGADSD